MKSWILYTFVMLSSIVLHAQSAEQIIEQTKQHYQINSSFSSTIQFEIDVPEISTQSFEGKIYLKGEKYRFVLDDQEFISDNVTQWHWIKQDVNEVQLSYISTNEDAITPSKIFGKYLTGSRYVVINQSSFNNEQLTEIEISPNKELSDDFFKMKAVINQNYHLKQMTLFAKDGSVYRFSISNEKKENINDRLFQFHANENPNVEIIDLR